METVYKFLFAVLILATLVVEEAAAATQHAVGGSQGWDESTDFTTWASGEKFNVGDQLVFKYTSGLHSVVELGSESAYKSCDISSAVTSLNGGNNVVKLTKPGTRYFACGTSGHCGQGMKVKITAAADDASSSTTTTPASSSSSSSSASSSPASTSATAAAAPAPAVSHGALMATLLLTISLFLVLF